MAIGALADYLGVIHCIDLPSAACGMTSVTGVGSIDMVRRFACRISSVVTLHTRLSSDTGMIKLRRPISSVVASIARLGGG